MLLRPSASSWNGSACVRRRILAPASARSVRAFSSTFRGTSVQQLQQWLDNNGVDTKCYGEGTSKSVDDLWEESTKNESILEVVDGRAIRIVKVLSLHILNEKGQILYEMEQTLPDGRKRYRGVALSEKLVGDEPWREAVGRAVQEELGTILPPNYKVTVFDDTYHMLSEMSASMSYPSLRTKYIFHRVSANVSDLPAESFATYEERPGGRLVTLWDWRFEKDVVPKDICATI